MQWLQASISQASREYFKRSASPVEYWYLVILVLLIVLSWAGACYWDRHKKQWVTHQADLERLLFVDLCKAHRLSADERRLLEQAADHHNRNHPALVFVDPTVLDLQANSANENASAFTALAVKLFCEPNGANEIAAERA